LFLINCKGGVKLI